jgi:hypothetical protein
MLLTLFFTCKTEIGTKFYTRETGLFRRFPNVRSFRNEIERSHQRAWLDQFDHISQEEMTAKVSVPVLTQYIQK